MGRVLSAVRERGGVDAEEGAKEAEGGAADALLL
jgi:hypothetical protein